MANADEKLAYGLFFAALAIPFVIAAFSRRPWLRVIGFAITGAIALWIATILLL